MTSALWEDRGMQADTKLKPFLQALWLVIMPSEWSSGPLIGHHTLWLVIIPSDWSCCLLIDHQGIGDLDLGLTINLQIAAEILWDYFLFWFNSFFLCVLCSLLWDLICVPCLILHFVPLLSLRYSQPLRNTITHTLHVRHRAQDVDVPVLAIWLHSVRAEIPQYYALLHNIHCSCEFKS